jgi:ABC-type nitrate/sulfonate/bicarbonate transport system substrate-binding protein
VNVIAAGVGPTMIAAVEHNKIDIGCEASPVCEQSVLAGKSIMWVNNTRGEDPEFSEFLMEALYVRPDYAAKNPKVVRGVVKALVRALRFIAEGSEEEHMVVLRNRFKGVPDAVLRESVKNVRTAVEPTGRISARSVEAHLKFIKAAGLLKTDVPWHELVANDYLPK